MTILNVSVAGSPYNEQCSWQNTGQTWFDVRDKTLKVCYSGIWQSILAPPSERNIQHLEYFVWQQVCLALQHPHIDMNKTLIPLCSTVCTSAYDSISLNLIGLDI